MEVLPPATPLGDDQAAEAASSAAVSLISALSVLVVDAPAGAPTAALAALRYGGPATSPLRVAGVPAVPCAEGGSIQATCAESGGRTIVASRSSACRLVDDSRGVSVVTDGELDITIDALGICRSGTVPPTAARTLQYRRFRTAVRDGPLLLESFEAPLLTQRLEPAAALCGDAGHMALDGRLMVARSNGVNVTLDAGQLELRLGAGGEPCEQRVEVGGRLAVSDHAGSRQFRALLHGFRAAFDLDSDAVRASVDGAATLDCVGAVTYASEAPLALGGACATAGVLRVALPSGAMARVVASEAGIQFDYDGDGDAERLVGSCADPAVAACR